MSVSTRSCGLREDMQTVRMHGDALFSVTFFALCSSGLALMTTREMFKGRASGVLLRERLTRSDERKLLAAGARRPSEARLCTLMGKRNLRQRYLLCSGKSD